MKRSMRVAAVLAADLAVLTCGGLALAGVGHQDRAHRPATTLTATAARPAVAAPAAAAVPARPSGTLTAAAAPAAPTAPATDPRAVAAVASPSAPELPALPAPDHRVAPTALVIPEHSAAPTDVVALTHGPRDVTVLLAGTVSVNGHATSLVGVEPASFRWFTPAPTLLSNPLWSAISHDEVAVSFALAAQRHLRLGETVSMAGQPVRIGAEADFGLAQAAVVVDPALARRLGAHSEELVVGRSDPTSLAASVRPLLGPSTVVSLEAPAPPPPSATSSRPTTWHQLYIDAAATCPGLSWTVLAAIGQVESADGTNDGPSSAGALGPMQFMPATWRVYGYDPFGTAPANIMDPVDAVYSAARMLCSDGASSGPAGLSSAVFAYNHASWYVAEVIALAGQYARLYG